MTEGKVSPNVLELFSGTRSVGKVCDELGWDSVSVDLLLPADHEVDILEWNYKQYPKDTFDVVWASPPCIAYSALKNCNIGRKINGEILTRQDILIGMDEADKLVSKTLEIIDYFKPEVWFIENPQTGRLKDRDIMKDKPYYDCDYCCYSDWGYRKRTRIWTNKKGWDNKLCKKDCINMDTTGKKHKAVVAGGGKNSGQINIGGGSNRLGRYRIPPDLIFSLFA
tara:strand:+ start:1247 stop:1918 length:672 start_codon:yes stop_codon:yes gene_type:complete